MNTIDNNMRLGGFAGFDLGSVASAPARTEKAGTGGLTVGTASPSPLDGLDQVDSAVEAALVRDDELGGLMGKVFDLPPPPMPNFC